MCTPKMTIAKRKKNIQSPFINASWIQEKKYFFQTLLFFFIKVCKPLRKNLRPVLKKGKHSCINIVPPSKCMISHIILISKSQLFILQEFAANAHFFIYLLPTFHNP